ncbi:hypothetical protein ACMD2_07133 [Ananas comosus]|uniref:Uncharacterized protein n=1 Tax=Ananas comosus TaxID=4615 RepID=A0A199VSK2_ANACO|nr:hypothetical protein ACMD2_07133 [Ananas comosus]
MPIFLIAVDESIPPPKPEQTLQPSPQSTVGVNVDNFSDAIPSPPSDKFYRFLPASSVVLLAFMFVMSAYNARGQPRDMSFVFLCYTILLFLFYCLRKYERLGSDAPPRLRRSLKAVILLLATGLNVAFACRASELVPWPFAAVIWASAAFVALIGYFSLFVWSNRVVGVDDGALPYSKLDGNSNSNKNNNNSKEEEKHFFHNELSPEDKA